VNQTIQNNHTVFILLTEHLYRIKDFHAHKLLAHNFYNVRMNQSVRKNISFIANQVNYDQMNKTIQMINSKSGKEKTILAESSLSQNASREGDTT
jgi:hypothetical protein